jgi:hypothetical protein
MLSSEPKAQYHTRNKIGKLFPAYSLLNPKVIFPDGAWEAWKFAHWYPGAVRTRSFRVMMAGCLRTLRLVRDR